MKCKTILIALFVGILSTPIYSQDQTSHQKTMAKIQELKSLLRSKKVKTTKSQPLIRPNQRLVEQPTPMLVDGSNPGDRPESSSPLVANEAGEPTEAALWFHLFLQNETEGMPMASFRSTGRMTFDVPYIAGFNWHVKVTTSEGEVRR